ncbi:MAG: DUF4406 domain-containing protein [Selenomonadaceae bacterium]|nr:DUF4406 domain-containing protein [Selenomonadaceae bacterium]
MKRYYISHPFTGNEEKNKADADRIRAALKEANPSICFMNPLGMFGNKDTDYCTALADALELLSSCEAVIFCPGWEDSTGCRAEKAFAIQQGIKILYLQDFPEVLRHLNDDKEDLMEALKDGIFRQEARNKPICDTIAKIAGGRIIYENRNDK